MTLVVVLLSFFIFSPQMIQAATNSGTLLQNGVVDDRVIDLKENLNRLGFSVSEDPTDYYGPITAQAVSEFQKYYGLQENGTADQATLDKINSILSSPLQKGKYNQQTVTLKEDLAKVGYPVPGNGTEHFGPSTEATVKQFQSENGLRVSGIAEEKTLAKIQDLLYGPMYNGLHRADVITLKENLAKIGFRVSYSPTDFYGPTTEAVVKQFQDYYGITEEYGIVGSATQSKIKSILNSPLQNGNYNNATVELKADLADLGFGVPGRGTNFFGPLTEESVRDFQKAYDLRVNGIADEVTLAKIEELVSGPMYNGLHRRDVITLKENLAKIGFVVSYSPTDFYGPSTEYVVKQFQDYYGITEEYGIVGDVTLAKIKSILNSPLQNGRYNYQTIILKEDLAKVGFPVPGNGTNYYGSSTEEVVKNFQKEFGLRENGIADEPTLLKLQTLVEARHKTTYTYYDTTFEDALNTQMTRSPQTDKYRNSPAYVSSSAVNKKTGGSIIENSVRLRTSPQLGTLENIETTVDKGAAFTMIDDNIVGDSYAGSNIWYKINYNGKELYVHSTLASKESDIVVTNSKISVFSETNTNSHVYGTIAQGKNLTILEKIGEWYRISYGSWRNAMREDVSYYLNPNNADQFQHLLLTSTAGVSATQLNNLLNGKGILQGKGQAFIDAGRVYSVNEIYLISHALLETGNGSSKLATGVSYNGKTVYNMFGIGAYDSDPINGGARMAYEMGWDTPEKAIVGGAKFISQEYIHNQYNQNTIYKMRWNFLYAPKQYATDVAWAAKQINRIKELYGKLDRPALHFDIPKFR